MGEFEFYIYWVALDCYFVFEIDSFSFGYFLVFNWFGVGV